MVGFRLPAILLRKIDKMAADIGADRSMIIRLMVEHVLGRGSPEVEVRRSLLITGLIGRKGRRDTVAGRIASAVVVREELGFRPI
jgi:metal-responsive CopG/Arc/MetJ family transcriptional regulator